MLESYEHEASSFVTVTYSPEHVPPDGSVSIRDAQLFLKRLRERVAPIRLRFFLVGEYGAVNLRPHYHVALFGLGPELHDTTRCTCPICLAWGMGHVVVGSLTRRSAAYVVSYVVKGKNHAPTTISAGSRSPGSSGGTTLKPEFSTMSRRPGIGAGAARRIAEAFRIGTMSGGSTEEMLTRLKDLRSLRLDGQLMALGRYLRSKTVLSLVDGNEEEAGRLLSVSGHTHLAAAQLERQARARELGTKVVLEEERQERIQEERRSRTRMRLQKSKEVL